MLVRKLLHTRYRLDDLEKSVRFYKDVLGLQEVRRHKSPRGSELVFLKAHFTPLKDKKTAIESRLWSAF
jgi:catechol 2,3-dioxygenase-like lactoylglutathione lyase family enzyme